MRKPEEQSIFALQGERRQQAEQDLDVDEDEMDDRFGGHRSAHAQASYDYFQMGPNNDHNSYQQ